MPNIDDIVAARREKESLAAMKRMADQRPVQLTTHYSFPENASVNVKNRHFDVTVKNFGDVLRSLALLGKGVEHLCTTMEKTGGEKESAQRVLDALKALTEEVRKQPKKTEVAQTKVEFPKSFQIENIGDLKASIESLSAQFEKLATSVKESGVDMSPVVEAVQNIRFPVPSTISAFKSSNQQDTSVVLTSDGKVPVEAAFTGTVTVALDKANDSVAVWSNTAKDGSGTNYQPIVDSDGHSQVDVLSSALPSGASTAANQTTIIGHVDGIETLLGTIDADTGNISTKIDTLAGAVSGTEVQVDVLTMPTTTVQATNLDIRDLVSTADSVALKNSAGTRELDIVAGGDSSGARGVGVWGSDGSLMKQLSVNASGHVNIADGGNSITVDNAALSVTGGGVEASALRVTLANDSTGVLSVDDNGGTLTVDGTVAATQSGTWNVTNISGTVSLPTGAATSAKQDIQTTALQLLDDTVYTLGDFLGAGEKGIAVFGRDDSDAMNPLKQNDLGDLVVSLNEIGLSQASGTISALNGAVDFEGDGAIVAQLTGTWDATVTFEATVDGTNWVAVQGLPTTGTTSVTTTTGNGIWQFALGGIGEFRVRASSYSSGTINVSLVASPTAVTKLPDSNAGITTIAGAVSGTEMQVDIVGSLPAGTAAIGKLAANSGVDIGDVDVTSISAGDNLIGRFKLSDGTDVADILDLTNSNPLTVAIVDGSGDQITSFGGGTQYTEDAAAAANPVGTALNLVRLDTPATLVSNDGDNVAARGSNYGALYTTLVDNSGNFVSVGGGTQYDEDAVHSSGAKVTLAGVVRQDTAAQLAGTDGDYSVLVNDASGRLHVNVGNTVTVASHAVTNAGTFAVQVDGNALTALQKIDDPVLVDDAAFTPATSSVMMSGYEADESSTDSVDEGDAGAARMTLDRKQIVTTQPHTAGGLTIFRSIDLDETEEEVKGSAGQVYGAWVTNTATSTRWLKFYNATAANVTVGTTTPVITIGIPGNSSDDISGYFGSDGNGIAFSTAITAAATTGVADNDTGAPGANEVIVNLFYK